MLRCLVTDVGMAQIVKFSAGAAIGLRQAFVVLFLGRRALAVLPWLRNGAVHRVGKLFGGR